MTKGMPSYDQDILGHSLSVTTYDQCCDQLFHCSVPPSCSWHPDGQGCLPPFHREREAITTFLKTYLWDNVFQQWRLELCPFFHLKNRLGAVDLKRIGSSHQLSPTWCAGTIWAEIIPVSFNNQILQQLMNMEYLLVIVTLWTVQSPQPCCICRHHL